jgi:hypothetical protein
VQTSWADTTDIVVSTSAKRIKSIRVTRKPTATAPVYIQLYDATSATPGVTAITDQIQVGFGEYPTIVKVNFHGKLYKTGVCWFCSTDLGATAPLTTEIPSECRLDYV